MSAVPLLAGEAFIQGNITIVPPVRAETNNAGARVVRYWNDGGTHRINITDNKGDRFAVFFDHRFIDSTTQFYGQVNTTGIIASNVVAPLLTHNQGMIYLHDYPGRSNSVLVIDQKGFREKILNSME